MKDKIVSFKTAKILKNKGIELFQHYDSLYSLYSKKGKHVYYMNYGFMGSGMSDGYIPAPTQTLVQKISRDKYDVYIAVNPIIHYVDNEVVGFNITIYHDNGQLYQPDDTFAVYEDAVEFAIKESLNFIEE